MAEKGTRRQLLGPEPAGTIDGGEGVAELKTYIPTYYGDVTDPVAREALPEFGDPYMPVVVRRGNGITIVLGSIDYFDGDAPDFRIERRPQGWVVFFHPSAGADPTGFVFLDDGRSFVLPEDSGWPPIRMAESTDEFPELDTLPVPRQKR